MRTLTMTALAAVQATMLALATGSTAAAPLFEDHFASISSNWGFVNDGEPTAAVGTNLTYGTLETSGGSFDFSIFQTNSNDADSTATDGPDFTDEFLDNSDVVYFSVLMQVPDLSAFGNNGGTCYAGFNTSGSNAVSYGLGLGVDGSGNITYRADTGSGTASLGGSVNEGQTVFLVARLSNWPDSSGYFPPTFEYLINPDPSAPEPGTWNTVTATSNCNKVTADEGYVQINAFSLSWNDDNDARFLIDELRVAMNWDDVTPIPEPATLALLGAGGLLAMGRRRRK